MIGDTLSGARKRRQVDLEQVHAATGIRVRYLRAIEEEDWEALPEDFYARSFIRKYAQFVGVDPEPLVEEFRRQQGATGRGGAPTSPFARTHSRKADALRRRRARQGVYAWIGVALLAAAVVVAVVLITSGGGEGGSNGSQNAATGGAKGAGGGKGGAKQASGGGKGGAGSQGNGGGKAGSSGTSRRFYKRTGVALAIEPTAEVWACVLDAEGKPLVDGLTLAAGETAGPFHASSYTAAFGNGSVAVEVDGKHVATPDTPSPMGFSVDKAGKLHDLPEGERPSCE